MMFPHGYPRASRVFDVTSMISIFSSCHPFLPPSPPSSDGIRSTFSGGEKASSYDGRFRAIRQTPRRATREIEKRERERGYLLGRRRRRRRSGEEAEKKSAEKAMVGETRRGFVARTVCRSGWTTRRGPFVSSARSIVYPGVDRWPIYTCTVAPPRAREDRHKWSSTRHSEAFHAAGVLATRYASTPTPSTPSRISSGRNNLSSARWRQGVVRRDVTRPVYMNGRRAERFPAFFDL